MSSGWGLVSVKGTAATSLCPMTRRLGPVCSEQLWREELDQAGWEGGSWLERLSWCLMKGPLLDEAHPYQQHQQHQYPLFHRHWMDERKSGIVREGAFSSTTFCWICNSALYISIPSLIPHTLQEPWPYGMVRKGRRILLPKNKAMGPQGWKDHLIPKRHTGV